MYNFGAKNNNKFKRVERSDKWRTSSIKTKKSSYGENMKNDVVQVLAKSLFADGVLNKNK